MKLPGMTAIAADSILDWIDPDEQARQNGAEARYYADAKLPYSPRNATPVFLEELLLARGVTRAQLYGSDENFTYNAEKSRSEESSAAYGGSLLSPPSTTRSAAAQDASVVPWTALVTVFSAEKDADPRGEARVNLNIDDLNFLYQELSTRVGADVAKFIVLYRQYGPETKEQEAESNASRATRRSRRRSGYLQNGASGGANAPNNQTPANVTVGNLAQARIDDSVEATTALKTPLDIVGARVVVGNVAYESPIRDSRDAANVNKLMTLLDFASTSESTTIVGRVNVNAAPRPVLAALPGLETADVQRIVSERPALDKAVPDDYRHASWLYTKGLVSLETMKSLYNKTTARGDVFRGQIVGFLDRSNEVERAEVVVDGATTPPRQVFFKDLSTLGKGFSDATLLGGLTTSAANVEEFGVSALDWQEASGVVDIERANSGYFGATDDPFASIDAAEEAAGVAFANAPSAEIDPGLNASPDPFAASSDPFGANDSSMADLNVLGTPAPTNADAAPGTSPSDATSDAAASETPTEEPQSRRDRLLNALRSSRESRSSRNRRLSGASDDAASDAAATPTANETPATATESAAPAAAGGAPSNNRAARSSANDESNASGGARGARGGTGARGGGRRGGAGNE